MKYTKFSSVKLSYYSGGFQDPNYSRPKPGLVATRLRCLPGTGNYPDFRSAKLLLPRYKEKRLTVRPLHVLSHDDRIIFI